METCGYVAVRKGDVKKGHDVWRINGERQVVYAKMTLPLTDQLTAASHLVNKLEGAKNKVSLAERLAAAKELVETLEAEDRADKKAKKSGKVNKMRKLIYE